jgi:hypothetical protein
LAQWVNGPNGELRWVDDNGVWTGFIWNGTNIQFRYPSSGRLASNEWVCALNQWWHFNAQGNMERNTTITDPSSGYVFQTGPGGFCTNCGPCQGQNTTTTTTTTGCTPPRYLVLLAKTQRTYDYRDSNPCSAFTSKT